jgi:D-alanyl-D-alanine endopeptidase (penicillin-binding protein 7)
LKTGGQTVHHLLFFLATILLSIGPVTSVCAAQGPKAGPPKVVSPDTPPDIRSASALVVNQSDGEVIFDKQSDRVQPIASITKLMTAMVVLDAQLPLDDRIIITEEDRDLKKGTHSRLWIGTELSRREMLHVALMSSENRAAAALSRAYPGGREAFIEAMNKKAASLGMWQSEFADSTGLSSDNVSTARDLAKMVAAAYKYPLIRELSTDTGAIVRSKGRPVQYGNSNLLVRGKDWDIGLSKTGYISEAGRCLVMQATVAGTPVIMVLLHSWGTLTRIGDANRLRRWMEALAQKKKKTALSR